ncbi:MAG: ROK family protein [bacterium]
MKKKLAIGVDLGGTNIKAGIIDSDGNVIVKISRLTEAQRGGQVVLKNILSSISDIISKNTQNKNIVSIGIGTPGLADNELGGVKGGAKNLPGWEGIPFKKDIEKKFNLPAVIDNDANMVTLGEFYCGAGKGVKNLVCLTLGTGIGGGIIFDGKIFRGPGNYAAEIGHMNISMEGPQCSCGSYGCLEAYASATAIVARTVSAIEKGNKTILMDMTYNDTSKITAKMITDAAEKGDALASAIIEETAKFLGVGIANLINLLNPEMVIISGGVAQAGNLILTPTIGTARQYSLKYAFDTVKIVTGKFKDEAGIIGAGMYSLKTLT